jgi:biotin carboxylase
MPSPGKITQFHAAGGLGVRVDSHVYNGYSVPPHYDSMIGKLITFADTRHCNAPLAFSKDNGYSYRACRKFHLP